MDPIYPIVVKDECPESIYSRPAVGSRPSKASSLPRPMEGLQDNGPPPFLTKTYDIVDDVSTDRVVSWSAANNSFVIWDAHSLAMDLLPKQFKHNNFSSFVRQLNTYGFRKVDPDKWEFAHEGFLRGQKHLLKTIRRRRPPSHAPRQHQASEVCLEVGRYGLDGEIERLKRDKCMLMAEVIKLRQAQQNTKAIMESMADKLQRVEQRQQYMMTFLAKAIQNPNLLHQLAEQQERKKELEDAISKKRRRPIDMVPANVDVETSQQVLDPEAIFDIDDEEVYGCEFSELEGLALGIEGLDELKCGEQSEQQQQQEVQAERTDEFWHQLFTGEIGGEAGTTGLFAQNDDDVDALGDRLGSLVSTSPK